MADGLGHTTEGSPMGEPTDGLAVFWGFRARNTPQLQDEGGRDRFRGETGLRILCPRAN